MVTPHEFREARLRLGLSISDLSDILRTRPESIRRWEMNSNKKTARDPNPIACQVLRWLELGLLEIDSIKSASS